MKVRDIVKKNIEEYLDEKIIFSMILQNKLGEDTFAKSSFLKAIDQIDFNPKLEIIENNIIEIEPLGDIHSFLYEAKFEYLFNKTNHKSEKIDGAIKLIVRGFGDPKYFEITKAELIEN